MTAFVLVSEAHTGGWVWREVAAGLRASGAEVCAATLTGMDGDRDRGRAPEADLETHIEDVLRLVDGTEAPEVVLVGHGYGIHPVAGAADRRPERIARVVHLDAGIPEDGDPPLALVPDAALRELLHGASGPDARPVPPPSRDGWQRWGSTAGLTDEALDRLTRLAAPQPPGTLTRPLRLTGAGSGLPVTGVFCTAGGTSTALAEDMVALGDPRLVRLTDPRNTFFDLGTGHWPMLSVPGELTDVLLRAAAGEGHRIPAPEQPGHLRPFPLDVPECPRERTGRVDLHLPGTGGPWPAVVFVHGGPLPAGVRPTPRDWPVFTGYARSVAELGAVGVTLDHRLHDPADYPRAAEDVAEAVALVRADPRVDGDRVALWFFSGGGLLSADWLAAPPPWLRCVAETYPVLAPLPSWGMGGSRFRPAEAVRGAGRLPVVLTRVELERPEFAVTVEEFLAAAKDCDARVEVVDVPGGHHGFEGIDRTEEARLAVRRAVRSVTGHLGG
ncbi:MULTISPECIES: alpha/beta fold hydrolase [unclassified Streptomyces]|uniref:alpha/beta fold hydrolase n=1 Tax=unclassified Streptomyces TaxID=2593676 RepID=UPI000BFA4A47|nr:alpha/beta fold hydrolase [Streptomyces sp. Ru87]PGH52029.1 alpha/beta hydrolase [Streptomyces sp. Ru87]